VLQKSVIDWLATTDSPCSPASAAGFTYAAAASCCPATTDPAIDKSRALVFGTAYPPADAAPGSSASATMILFMTFLVTAGPPGAEGFWRDQAGTAPLVHEHRG